VPETCSGVAITGVLHDAQTNLPVAQGWAVLESGTQLSTGIPFYEFYPSQTVATDVHGAFKLCVATISNPSAIVTMALDSAGKAYPPFVTAASAAADLGTIPLGTLPPTAPAVITGVITSAPIAKTGSIVAQYPMLALDGSKSAAGVANLWSLAIPSFNTSQTDKFTTTAGACPGEAPFCATYVFTLPSQKPIQPFTDGAYSGYLQGAGAPLYMIYAVPDGTPSCVPQLSLTVFQKDGSTLLTGNPGAQITASDVNFTGCQ
jgi:hypothetical protein